MREKTPDNDGDGNDKEETYVITGAHISIWNKRDINHTLIFFTYIIPSTCIYEK